MMIWEDLLYIYVFIPKFRYMMFLNLFSSLWARNTCTHSWQILGSSWHVAVAEFSLFVSRVCSLIRGYLHDTFLLKMSRNKPGGSFVKTEACVALVHSKETWGAFHSTKIPIWNFRNFTCPMELYIPVTQTRPKPPRVWLLFLWAGYKRAVLWTTILWNRKGHFGPTDRNDQTGQTRPSSKLVPNIPVGPNRNGPFYLVYPPKFPEFWVEWKASMNWGHVHKYPFLFENGYFFLRFGLTVTENASFQKRSSE